LNQLPLGVEHLRTDGIFSLDGQDFEVENNVWLIGDRKEVVVIDAPHSAPAITEKIAGRKVVAIVATHGHNDHINAAVELRRAVSAPVFLHPDDLALWEEVYGGHEAPDEPLVEGNELSAADSTLTVVHTPGHTPGGCCLYEEQKQLVFSGDTLFKGGPGATGRRFSDFPRIIESIRDRLLVLPSETLVLTGHGEATSIGDEAPHLEEWIQRGH
jgi:glyoxylase-like metal-dependent hydrolase (beta-lactamase superfamily II)